MSTTMPSVASLTQGLTLKEQHPAYAEAQAKLHELERRLAECRSRLAALEAKAPAIPLEGTSAREIEAALKAGEAAEIAAAAVRRECVVLERAIELQKTQVKIAQREAEEAVKTAGRARHEQAVALMARALTALADAAELEESVRLAVVDQCNNRGGTIRSLGIFFRGRGYSEEIRDVVSAWLAEAQEYGYEVGR